MILLEAILSISMQQYRLYVLRLHKKQEIKFVTFWYTQKTLRRQIKDLSAKYYPFKSFTFQHIFLRRNNKNQICHIIIRIISRKYPSSETKYEYMKNEHSLKKSRANATLKNEISFKRNNPVAGEKLGKETAESCL